MLLSIQSRRKYNVSSGTRIVFNKKVSSDLKKKRSNEENEKNKLTYSRTLLLTRAREQCNDNVSSSCQDCVQREIQWRLTKEEEINIQLHTLIDPISGTIQLKCNKII